MIKIKNPYDCCGCTACASICARSAISMHPNSMGFLYPKVDVDKCNDCGLCEQVCAFHSDYERLDLYDEPLVYGAYNKIPQKVQNSQSGGLFYTLAEQIILRGGVVYGAAFKDVTKVVHVKATTIEELQSLRGSKYVQSDLKDIFKDLIVELRSNRIVMFSGTGCQVAGLRSFVKRKRIKDENLILCDIVCHGVSSPYVWKENIKFIEQSYKSRVLKANFRDKKLFGWHSSISSYLLENDKVVTSDRYNKAFGLGYINRKSCDICYYTNFRRPGDVTLGDFWGLKSVHPQLDAENKGVNLVLINSDKGKTLLDDIRNKLVCFTSNMDECKQPNLETPTIPSPYRDKFEQIFLSKGYYAAIQSFPQLKIKSKFRIFTEKVANKIKRIFR